MEFHFLRDEYLALDPSIIENPFVKLSPSYVEIDQYQKCIKSFEDYTKSFSFFFLPNKTWNSEAFQILLLYLMHATNTPLRKHRKGNDTSFKCYCYRKNKHNRKYSEASCKFRITITKSSVENNILILSTNLVHNHVMLPKEFYLNLVFKSSMSQFKELVQEQIQKLINQTKDQSSLEPAINQVTVNNERIPRPLRATKESLHVKELRPSNILEMIKKSEKPKNRTVQILLNVLENKNNHGLKKKFDNLVNQSKREMLMVTQ